MIIFLYGQDSFRSREKLRAMKDKYIREIDPQARSLSVLDGESASLDDISRAVSSASLFSSKRMTVVENIFLSKNKAIFSALEKFFSGAKADNENIIIFFDVQSGDELKGNSFFKYLLKQKFVQEFKPLSQVQAGEWLRQRVGAGGARINPAAAGQLLGLFGSDLWALDHEINKIINFKKAKQGELIDGGGEPEIVAADVEKLCRGQADENIFALTDAISQKNRPRIFELFEKELEAGVAEQYLLTMIQRQFKILLQIRQALDSGVAPRQVAKELKLHPFAAQKALGQVRNFSLFDLKKIFSALVELDAAAKSGQASLQSGLSLIFARI